MFSKRLQIGIIGSGYVSRHFYLTFQHRKDLSITRVLTRRPHCPEYPNAEILTHEIEDLLDHCDLVYECSGDPIHAAEMVDRAMAAGKPVVTTNSEFHVTTGSYFAKRGLLSEAEGDQPGALAALHHRAVEMGFNPLAYINIKGFLNPNPTLEEMTCWSKRNGISLANTVSFTDGTKIQFEQALVANGLQATLLKAGMVGLNESETTKVAEYFGKAAKAKGDSAISDYILYPGAPHGVILVVEHDASQRDMLRYVKLGSGPYYTLHQDRILIHMEALFTMQQLFEYKRPLLNNSTTPTINVAAIAKQPLSKGMFIENGVGSFALRGMAVPIAQYKAAVPIGLMQQARLIQAVEPGQILTFEDVELPETLALRAWQTTLESVYARAHSLVELRGHHASAQSNDCRSPL